MSKVRNFAEITPNLTFSEFNCYELYSETFEKSELGRMKKISPLREMAENFGLASKNMVPKVKNNVLFNNCLILFCNIICNES